MGVNTGHTGGTPLGWVPVPGKSMTEFHAGIGNSCRIILRWTGSQWSVVVRDDELDIDAEVAVAEDLDQAKAAAARHMAS